MNENSNIFINKKILIYGLGKSGISTFKFLKRKNVCVKGNISDYEGRTQMEIRTEKQIKIRE